MTEKRFKNVEENLEWGTVQYFTYYDEKITDKELEKLVNHLLNQNDGLNDENEQLKQFKEDVFNKIDMHLRMLPTARDNVNGEYGDPSLYSGAIYMLETLKKELQMDDCE